MNEKQITAECAACDSSFTVAYVEEFVSQEFPECCPFCGETIEEFEEHQIDDEDDENLDSTDW